MQQLFTEIFGLLISAVILVYLFKRLALPAILAYLLTGVLAGPHGFDWLGSVHDMHQVAELGVVFLLFSLGLEFSFSRLIAMRNIVFGIGSIQVALTILVLFAALALFGVQLLSAFTIAALVALSSTAVVVKTLKDLGLMQTRSGQLSVGVLLFQDIAVVPLLIVIPLLASHGDNSIALSLLWALAKGGFVCVLLWAIGKWVLPKVFNEVAQMRNEELFVLTTLLVALFAAGLTYLFGLSMALGAFLAGMMLGESQYRHQLESDIRPFRDILMGLFFATVGMQLDLYYVMMHIHFILLALVILFVFKVALIMLPALWMGERKGDSLGSGFMLWQMGEFGFVLISLAAAEQVISAEQASFLVALAVLSMAVTPYCIEHAQAWSQRLLKVDDLSAGQEKINLKSLSNHVVICGYGRVGQNVARFLDTEAIDFIAIDLDPFIVQQGRASGARVMFGDVSRKTLLERTKLEEAQLVVITFSELARVQAVTEVIRQVAPDVKILARMPDDGHLDELKDAGVSEVVPESLEAALMLSSHVLYMAGVPMQRIIRRVSLERANRYSMLHDYFVNQDVVDNEGVTERLEYLHVVALADSAYAVGKTLDEIEFSKRKVTVAALRRGTNEIEKPQGDTVLNAQDVLILKGKPRRVERCEQYLLNG